MDVPRLGVESELQLPAYTTATATRNPSHICDLHHSSEQHWIPNRVIEARDQICILVDPSRVYFHNGNSLHSFQGRRLKLVARVEDLEWIGKGGR